MTDLTTQIAELREIVGPMTPSEWNHLGYAGQDGVIHGPRQVVVASLSTVWGKAQTTGHQAYKDAAGIVALRNTALPIIEAQAAEIARLSEHNGELRDKLFGIQKPDCACSWDNPGDVCLHHSPIIKRQAAEIAALRAELDEQARVNGMGGEREAGHLARTAELEAELARLREEANISATMQEKVRAAIAAIGGSHE